MSDDENMGLDPRNATERRVLRKLLKADVEGYDRQIAALGSQIRTLQAQADTLEGYRHASEAKLWCLEDDDDNE
jgi:hypothetical protein